jgi:hypothetical protein
MAVSLLPDYELANYQQLRAWLLDVDDKEDFPNLAVAMSFASVGNAPALVVGTLLRRVDPLDLVPHILFLVSAGSLCFQIALMSDHLEDHLPPVLPGSINIIWSNVIGGAPDKKPIRIQYSKPVHFNWASRVVKPQPVHSLILEFNPGTAEGSFTPVIRPES